MKRRARPRKLEDHRPSVREFLKALDRALEKMPPMKKRSVFRLGIVKSEPERIAVEGRCQACTDTAKPLWEYVTKKKSKVRVCSRCSDKIDKKFYKRPLEILPGSYGSRR